MKKAAIVLFIIVIPIVFLLMLVIRDLNFDLYGFAVDKNGLLYIGKTEEITVMNNGRKIKTISPHTSKGYAFTIVDGERIVLATSNEVYNLDLEGNILSKTQGNSSDVNKLRKEMRSYEDVNGRHYKYESVMGYYTIKVEDAGVVRTIYRMPILDYCCRILLFACLIAIVIAIIMLIISYNPLIKKNGCEIKRS